MILLEQLLAFSTNFPRGVQMLPDYLVDSAKANNVKILETTRSDLKIDLTDSRAKNRAPDSFAFSFDDELPFLN